MSGEIIDTVVFGLMLGATVLAAIKVRAGVSGSAFTMLSGFALITAVTGLRMADHLALETLGPENNAFVVVADISLTILGLILIFRGVTIWKSNSNRMSHAREREQVLENKIDQPKPQRADFFKMLHVVACDLARRTEALVGVQPKGVQTRVSALEALFEACGANLHETLSYDCLTVELAPRQGMTAHSMTKDIHSGALKVHFYPVRQSLVNVCDAENGRARLIGKTSGKNDSTCWTRLDMADIKQALLGSISLDDGYTLTIAVGSKRLDGFQISTRFFFEEFMKLLRPLLIVALGQASSPAQAAESSTGVESPKRASADAALSARANSVKVAAPAAPGPSAAAFSVTTPVDELDEL